MKASELRQSILQIAVQGRLVPQDPNDEPASELLKRIQQEKAQLIRDGKIKKDKPLPPINEDEVPYDLPEGWVWCRLNDIYNFIDYRGKTPNKINTGIPLVTAANIKKGFMDFSDRYFISNQEYDTRKTRGIAKRGDILFTTEAPLGNVSLVDLETYSTGQRVIAFQGYNGELCNPVFAFFLLSHEVQMRIYEKRSGMTATGVKAALLKLVLIPLPPLAEQYRIVAKVAELMALCDELEVAEKELDALEEHFAEYLPKSILQSAVQGKLVEQDSRDEPASELLKRIHRNKAHLVKEGKIKNSKPLPPITEDEIPYDLPDGWAWCRLGDVGTFIRGNGIKRSDVCPSGVSCIRYGEIYTTYNIFTDKAISFVDENIASKSVSLEYGDVLMTLTGENKDEIGKTVAFLGKEETVISGDLATFTNHHQDPMYLSYFMNSPFALLQKATAGTGNIIVHISCDKLSMIPLPLPPLAEQHRIVAKVDELLVLCGELTVARTSIAKVDSAKVISFPQQLVGDEYEDIGMAARGDGTGPMSDKLRQAIDDWDDGDE